MQQPQGQAVRAKPKVNKQADYDLQQIADYQDWQNRGKAIGGAMWKHEPSVTSGGIGMVTPTVTMCANTTPATSYTASNVLTGTSSF